MRQGKNLYKEILDQYCLSYNDLHGRGENMDDLFQIGCVGLIKAIDNFDINQDVQFSTYGVPMIVRQLK